MGAGYSLDHLLGLLVRRGVLDRRQARDLASRERVQRESLARRTNAGDARRIEAELTPADVLASFRVPLDDGSELGEERIMRELAEAEGYDYLKIDPLDLDPQLITGTLPRPFARRHRILPIDRGEEGLRVATDDPFNVDALESVRELVRGRLHVVVATKTALLQQIHEIYGFRRTLDAAARDLRVGNDIQNLEQLFDLGSLDDLESNDQHVVNAVDYLLHYAFDQRASDIHVEPKREQALIRMRIDGVLHTIQRVPMVVQQAMVSRIKTMARLDIAEKRRPQDGRFKTRHGDEEIELRISTLPVAFGEKVVVRVFDPGLMVQDLDDLGFSRTELEHFQRFVFRPHGLVLVTGPTGSGKTTTLYSALHAIADDRVNITTIEDPIEMVFPPFNQTAVNERAGITFASALRTLLRQDPDVVMVGEVRDRETAEHAVQAALTGHLVLTTVHANDTASALTRLLELGVAPFLVASTVIGVVAQRLARCVCEGCATTTTLHREQLRALGLSSPDAEHEPNLPVRYGIGCPDCRHTGLRGRSGVFEVMPVDGRIRQLVVEGATSADIFRAARQEGMATLRESGIRKLARGVTSFEEVLRVTAE